MGMGGQRQASAASPPRETDTILLRKVSPPKGIRSSDRPESLHRLRKIIEEHVNN